MMKVTERRIPLEFDRNKIMNQVVTSTFSELENKNLDFVLSEALYLERQRIKRFRANWFTRIRKKEDQQFWSSVQSQLLQSIALSDRRQTLNSVIGHFTHEITGRFDPKVYALATTLVPVLFDWLLNAASFKRLVPWNLKAHVQDRLRILGEVDHLKRLSQQGTVLLVPTHQSNIDSLLIGYVIHQIGLPPFSYGAGLNLFSNPVLSFFMGRLGAYTVDRTKANDIYKRTLKNYSTSILREGVHSIFFPGGGRSRSGAIEKKLKLGLLGTGLEAELQNHLERKSNPRVFIVPMVTSYHFVLEASSLIEDFLADQGKHQFMATEEEAPTLYKFMNFFWTLFASSNDLTVRIGKPMDVFGNFVDERGQSMGPNGTTIDPTRWLSTEGVLCRNLERDQEYTRELGDRLGDRFHRENVVLTSHAVAYAYFELLREQYPDLSLYRLLRLSPQQRRVTKDQFMRSCAKLAGLLRTQRDRGRLFLSQEMTERDDAWVKDGLEKIGQFHSAKVVDSDGVEVWTEDMNLLYYYRNRLTGFGLRTLGGARGSSEAFLD